VHYTGGGNATLLNYDGHPGTDFRTIDISTNGYGKAPVFATVSGTLFYPWEGVGLTGNPYHAYCYYHALGEVPDQQKTYLFYYLHLSTHPAGIDANSPPCNNKGDTQGEMISITDGSWIDQSCVYTDQNGKNFTPISLPLAGGTHVEVPAGKLCVIAVSGDGAVAGSRHLHFRIQQLVPLRTFGQIPGHVYKTAERRPPLHSSRPIRLDRQRRRSLGGADRNFVAPVLGRVTVASGAMQCGLRSCAQSPIRVSIRRTAPGVRGNTKGSGGSSLG
jgi:hypothetical protein